MTRLGVVFLPQLAPERLREVAQVADNAGLEELWLWEDCFFEGGVASASAALAWTERLRVGIGLLPVPLRNVALTAMDIATLQRLFPGRVRVGVGHGVQSWMSQVGARAGSPLTLLREYLTALRALLDGEEHTATGRYVKLDKVRLNWPPLTSPELLAGAIGPRSLRLSGELADGTILTGGTSLEGVRRARALIEQGQAEAGRSGRHHLVAYVLAATRPGRGGPPRAPVPWNGVANRVWDLALPATLTRWRERWTNPRQRGRTPSFSSRRGTSRTWPGSFALSPVRFDLL